MAKTTKARKKTALLAHPDEDRLKAERKTLKRVARMQSEIRMLASRIMTKRRSADIALERLAKSILERAGGIPRDLPLSQEP
jgi:hypothetical protein